MGLFQLGKKKEYLGELFLWFSPAAAAAARLKENRVLFFLFLQSFGYRQKRESLLLWSR